MVQARAAALGLAGYVQSHALPEGSTGHLASVRGSPPDFDGIAQLWWHVRVMTPAEKEAARRASAELLEDERCFIDLAASPIFLVEDHELVRLFLAGRAPGGKA
ncbi:MAG: ethyl tert-butyl ether degradation protein EthD [Variovorax sp.]|nr:ethyl tert-butyl ether degradation protein EthD [Variovorax sp.]